MLKSISLFFLQQSRYDCWKIHFIFWRKYLSWQIFVFWGRGKGKVAGGVISYLGGVQLTSVFNKGRGMKSNMYFKVSEADFRFQLPSGSFLCFMSSLENTPSSLSIPAPKMCRQFVPGELYWVHELAKVMVKVILLVICICFLSCQIFCNYFYQVLRFQRLKEIGLRLQCNWKADSWLGHFVKSTILLVLCYTDINQNFILLD